MSDQLNIRNVPPEIHAWIEERRLAEAEVTKNEFLLGLLRREFDRQGQLALFGPAQRTERVPGALPFKFVDLFGGIGGMRLGLQRAGGRCVYTSEWDRYAQHTYKEWFGEVPKGDIRKIEPDEIPDHDVLAAGFPCQPFSIAGVSKKKSLGRAHGFRDATQGTLFFYLATIVELKRPPVLLLENVKNLLSHDEGRTWKVIDGRLKELDYVVFPKIIDAAAWVPQHRERLFAVCFDRRTFGDSPPFTFPDPPAGPARVLRDILDPKPDPKYTLSDHLWNYLQEYAERHREKGNGFGFGLADPGGITRTLSARYYKDGSEILIAQRRKSPRRLTPRECALLMGFEDELAAELGFPNGFPIVVSDTQAYRQFGNAVVPRVVEAVANKIIDVLVWHFQTGCLVKGRSTS
jgi:DNA (cytosine-5)-methyltransferase 1